MGQRLKERIAYDANGNILKYLRKSITGTDAHMDSLNYLYYANTNRLKRITDSIQANTYTSSQDNLILDIDNQPDNNYVYDAIGNLIKDSAEHITGIKWNVYGKIQEITKNVAGDITTIKYTYDALGNRISQTVIPPSDDPVVTWYVRDAQGNLMSIYSAEGDGSDLEDLTLKQSEKFLYGSSRLGLITLDDPDVDGGPGSMQYYYGKQWYERGAKQYELTNHIGNVLATISDRKFGIPSDTNSSLIDHYEPHIITAQDYYPFGMMSRVALPNSGKTYKFGFNGKMNDDGVKGLGNQQDYGMRIYDPRIGKFLSVDPLTRSYPELSPYQFGSNRPIDGIDLDGLEWTPARPNNGNLPARDQTSVKKGIDPSSFKVNPHLNVVPVYNPIVYPGGSTGIGSFSPNSNSFNQYKLPENEYEQQQQSTTNERNWLNAGYNPDGSKPPLMRLSENKTWNSFANNLALPLIEYGSLLEGGVSAIKFLRNPFRGLTPGEAGLKGEELMFQDLSKRYAGQNVKISTQVQIKMNGKRMIGDAVVSIDGIILEVAESKFNTSAIKPNTGQEMFFIEKQPGKLIGKKATSEGLKNIEVDPSKIKLTEYRWNPNGTGTVINH
jgi:RHS repeat-associated protein